MLLWLSNFQMSIKYILASSRTSPFDTLPQAQLAQQHAVKWLELDVEVGHEWGWSWFGGIWGSEWEAVVGLFHVVVVVGCGGSCLSDCSNGRGWQTSMASCCVCCRTGASWHTVMSTSPSSSFSQSLQLTITIMAHLIPRLTGTGPLNHYASQTFNPIFWSPEQL
jgi:hypothetical protein